MKVKWNTKKNKLSKMMRGTAELDEKQINVGVFGKQAWLAGIHEFGCDIQATRAKYLTVPCSPKAKGKSARDFKNLFVFNSSTGEKFLAREVGKDGFELLFWLTKKVHIPERAFLRNGYDSSIQEIINQVSDQVCDALEGKAKAREFCKAIGLTLSSAIKDKARDMKDPPNHWATIATKGSSNPLADTGDMIGSITYQVK